jgi:hypothetical protein
MLKLTIFLTLFSSQSLFAEKLEENQALRRLVCITSAASPVQDAPLNLIAQVKVAGVVLNLNHLQLLTPLVFGPLKILLENSAMNFLAQWSSIAPRSFSLVETKLQPTHLIWSIILEMNKNA